jgi:hypothetical protein
MRIQHLVKMLPLYEPRYVRAAPWLRRLVAGFPPRRPGFEPRSGHVGFVVDKVTLGEVFSEYFGFPRQSLFHRLLHTRHLSSGAGTIGQLVADAPSGLSLTPPQETIKKVCRTLCKQSYRRNVLCLSMSEFPTAASLPEVC